MMSTSFKSCKLWSCICLYWNTFIFTQFCSSISVFWLVKTWFFGSPRDQRCKTCPENVPCLNQKWGKIRWTRLDTLILALRLCRNLYIRKVHYKIFRDTAQKMKFSMKELFTKCDQIGRILRIWSHLVKKSLMENFIFLCSERCL